MKWFVVAISAALLCTLALPAGSREPVQSPEPLPDELEDYYWNLRRENKYWFTSIIIGLPPKDMGWIVRNRIAMFSPYREFQWLKFAIEHDAGELDTETSKLAGEYLRENVIDPIMTYKAVKMQNGHIATAEEIESKYFSLNLSREELDRLVLAELLFLYVREYVYFPPNKAPGNNRYEESVSRSPLPAKEQIISFYASIGLPQVNSFPAETISMQQGICWQQAIALATLYKIEGYDLALYLIPASPTLPPYPIGGYHGVVLLRDEWGVNATHIELKTDSMGGELEGTYLMLDPMYDYMRAQEQAQSLMGALAGMKRNQSINSLEEMDALQAVCGFLEQSPYMTQIMPMITMMDLIPFVKAKFIGKL